MPRINNRKLPAWIGSILFHAVLLLLILFCFAPSPDRSAPGERTAVGSIVFQTGSGDRQQAESAQNDSPTDESDMIAVELEKFANVNLNVRPPTLALAPGQNQGAPTPGGSATEITGSLLQGTIGRGADNQTGEAAVQIFGVNGKGTKFMYVFDRSGSMEGAPIRAAKAELIRSLESLGDLHQFNILFYSGDYRLWRQGKRLVFATPTEKQNAVQFIESMTAEGGTRHFEPLLEAIAHRPDVIFFLTDGEAQDDLTAEQLRRVERANNVGRGAQINIIQFGSGGLTYPPSRSLQQMAEQNEGQHRYVNVKELQ